MKRTVIISGFPGVGKSHFSKNTNLDVSDSDSSEFPKDGFPSNYLKHIKGLIGKKDIILVSSHKEVRDALSQQGIDFILCYPSKDLKVEYISRYHTRGSELSFIKLLDTNYDVWIKELAEQEGCDHLILQKGEHLSDGMIREWTLAMTCCNT